ncbi:MAG: hypothetical protein GQ540_03550 [Lutibacter sp.]|uniref:hypothetical protein n=1 Tax=Lutibacter sp. TaxID=1925666 RepID=UPI0019E50574|nr:hypothetical protein [Lutibacter sp.]NOR27587.1 hypothetical protein [Lutibacter sp.]
MDQVKVKFNFDWMGNPAGSTILMYEDNATMLNERGTVDIIVDKKKVDKTDKDISKSVEKPEKNKMMVSPQKKKSGRPKKTKK